MERWIKKEVFNKYPRTEKEKQGCRQEIERMRFIRDQYAKRLNGQEEDSEKKSDNPKEV